MNSKLTKGILALALLGSSSAALAHEKGDWLLRVGGAQVDPKSNNGDVVSVGSGSSAVISLGYMITENWGVDVLAAWPFTHDISLVDGPEVASTEQLPPTVTLQYHFFPNSDFQPYVGLGINFTTFFDEETSGLLAGSTLKLDDSWGVAGQIGIDWMLGDKWFFNANAMYMDIETDAYLDGAFLEKVEIDPMVYAANVGYRF